MNDSINVLLIDDEESFLEPMSKRLKEKGFQVKTATSGSEALKQVKPNKEKYQVAVIDQIMGPPNGTQIMLELHKQCPALAVIIMTGWGDMEPGEEAMELGAYRYMSKSLNIDELALNIRTAARFGRERQKGLALQTLVRAGQRIGSAQREDELYSQLYYEAESLLPGLNGFLISRYDESSQLVSFPFVRVMENQVDIPSRSDGKGISEFVIRKKEPVLVTLGDNDFRNANGLNPPHSSLGYCSSLISAPLFLNGRVNGTIQAFTFDKNINYSREHLELLQAFANQVAVSISNTQQLEEAGQLRDAAAILAGKRGRDAVVRAIVEEAHKLIKSEFTGLILQERDGTLRKIQPVIPEEFYESFGEPRQQRGVTRVVVDDRQPRVIQDTFADDLVKDSVREKGIRSMLAFPLIHTDRVLGVLYGHTFTQRYFSSHDIDLWTTFATQAAATLDRALEEEQHVKAYIRLAKELGNLAEKMNLKDTLKQVATAAKVVFEADTCRLAYVDPPTGRILDWAWAEGDPNEYRRESRPRPDGITNHVLRTQEVVFHSTDDLQKKPFPHPDKLAIGLQSVFSIPLVYGGRTIGVLHCNYLTKKQMFNERIKTLVEAFGARAAMALNRARRDQINNIWRVLDQKAVTCPDLKTLYKLFVQSAYLALNADFAVFYPYDPTTSMGKISAIEEECVYTGDLRTPWQSPQGGLGGGVHQEIENNSDGWMIVNDLDSMQGRFNSSIAIRETIKGYVALRLDVIPSGKQQSQIAGMLFLNYRTPTAFEASDIVELQHACKLIAAEILKLNLQTALQQAYRQRNKQLRAVVEISRAFGRKGESVSLDLIAENAVKALAIDACTLLEYVPIEGVFSRRGIAGLRYPDVRYTLPPDLKSRYMDEPEPTVIPDVLRDEVMKDSDYVQREDIKSAIIVPMRVEGKPLGLLFASYRESKIFPPEEYEAIELFASLAALVLHNVQLGDKLNQTQQRLDKRLFLDSVSIIDATWRHSQIQKASAIRNYASLLKKRLYDCDSLPSAMDGVADTIEEIDRLGTEIADAPPRVPQSWEMQKKALPLTSLIEKVAEREENLSLLLCRTPIDIHIEIDELDGVLVQGYHGWLLYALEALIQNARNAMAQEGKLLISGVRRNQMTEIRIQDSGNGVPEEIRSKLFQELIPKEQDKIGMGIGCLLAATIIEEHYGSIELEKSDPGDTIILIRLPIFAQGQPDINV